MNSELSDKVKAALELADKFKCKSCPHIVGDAYQRDCAFPDCMPFTLEELVQSSSAHVELIRDLHAALLASEEARGKAERQINLVKDAAIEAADEWRGFVVEDTAHINLVSFVEQAIDAAIQGESK